MITKYKKYVDKIAQLRNEIRDKELEVKTQERELELSLKDDLHIEFSKYLKPVKVNQEIFYLLTDNFGLEFVINKVYERLVAVYGVYKIPNQYTWKSIGIIHSFNPELSIEDFVKECVEKLKEKSKEREKEKEKRELRKIAKKYNI